MSTSDSLPSATISVNPGDDAGEVTVLNSRLEIIQTGIGKTTTEPLLPGLYKVVVLAGARTEERHVILKPGDQNQTIEIPPMRFSSAAPLENTAQTHEYHQEAAERVSKKPTIQAGAGAEVFIFARHWSPSNTGYQRVTNPAMGLTLEDAAGNQLADIGAVSEKDSSAGDPWAAATIAVNPGAYCLTLRTAKRAALRQSIIVSPGWQTQVFLLQRGIDREETEICADLANASILIARVGKGFQRSESHERLTELARAGLAARRQFIPEQDLEMMLWQKHDNPMLGILGGHCLLLDKNPRIDLLSKVVNNLRQMLGPMHADVNALALACNQGSPEMAFSTPPMLLRSWRLILKESASRTDLVPRTSLAARVADHLWGDGLWFMWQDVDEGGSLTGQPEGIIPVRGGLPLTSDKFIKQLTRLTAAASESDDEELELTSGMDEQETRLAAFLIASILSESSPTRHKRFAHLEDLAQMLPRLRDALSKAEQDQKMMQQIIKNTGLPGSRVESLIEKLMARLDTLLP